MGNYILLNGLVLGCLTFLGWATVFHKLPEPVKNFCAKHSFLVDLLTTLCTYAALGSTIVALLASAWVGLLFEVWMYIRRNKQDFTWLYDMISMIMSKLREVGQFLHEKNEEYQARQLVQTTV